MPSDALQDSGRRFAELADALEAGDDREALDDAAGLLSELLPPTAEATDLVARRLGIGARLADDWLTQTLRGLRAGDDRVAAARRLRVLSLAWSA